MTTGVQTIQSGSRVAGWLSKTLFWTAMLLLLATVSADRLHWLVYDKAWINPFHEGFALTFVSTIKMALPGDQFYHYFGLTLLPLCTRFIHFVTARIAGTPELTLAYIDVFGKLYLSLIWFGILAFCLAIIREARQDEFAVPIVIILLIMNLISYYELFYHKIVNTIDFFELYFYAYIFLFTVILSRYNRGKLDDHAMTLAVFGGGLSGSLFFDFPIFGWMFLFFASSLFVLTSPLQRWRCVGVSVLSGICTGLFLIFIAYGFNFENTIIAILQHVWVTMHGTDLVQPDFRHEFFDLFLSPKSIYYQRHLVIVCAVAIFASSTVDRVFRAVNKKTGDSYAMLAVTIDLVLLISFGAFAYTLYLHPTSTVADSLTFTCLFYVGCRLAVMVCARTMSHWTRFPMLSAAATIVGVGLIAATLSNVERWSIWANTDRWSVADLLMPGNPGSFFFRDRVEGRLVRSVDNFLNRLRSRYTAVESPGSYWMFPLVIFPLRYTGDFFFVGSGVGGWPRFLPIEAELERDRIRRYHFVSATSVVSVSNRCEVHESVPPVYADRVAAPTEWCAELYSPFGNRYVNVAPSRLPLSDDAYIYPVPASPLDPPLPAVDNAASPGDAMYARAATDVAWRAPADMDSLRDLESGPGRVGIKEIIYDDGRYSVGWSFLPVSLDDVKPVLTPMAQGLANGEFRSYLLRLDGSFYKVYTLIFVRIADNN